LVVELGSEDCNSAATYAGYKEIQVSRLWSSSYT